jgi:hypothetical protein
MGAIASALYIVPGQYKQDYEIARVLYGEKNAEFMIDVCIKIQNTIDSKLNHIKKHKLNLKGFKFVLERKYNDKFDYKVARKICQMFTGSNGIYECKINDHFNDKQKVEFTVHINIFEPPSFSEKPVASLGVSSLQIPIAPYIPPTAPLFEN